MVCLRIAFFLAGFSRSQGLCVPVSAISESQTSRMKLKASGVPLIISRARCGELVEFWEAKVSGWSDEVVYTDWSTSGVIGRACSTCTSFEMTTVVVKCVYMLLFLCWLLYKTLVDSWSWRGAVLPICSEIIQQVANSLSQLLFCYRSAKPLILPSP